MCTPGLRSEGAKSGVVEGTHLEEAFPFVGTELVRHCALGGTHVQITSALCSTADAPSLTEIANPTLGNSASIRARSVSDRDEGFRTMK